MRKLRLPIMILALILAVYCWRGQRWARQAGLWLRQIAALRSGEAVHVSQTYLIPTDRWLSFALPVRSESLRIATTASLGKEPAEQHQHTLAWQRPGWTYTVEYRLLGPDGQTVHEGQCHCRAQLLDFQDTASGANVLGSYYLEKDRVPLDTQEFRLVLRRWQTVATALHVRVARLHPQIRDVTVRMASLVENPHYRDVTAWQLINPRRRARLGSASVHPLPFLSPTEQQNLMHWTWQPLAPEGTEDDDYVRRPLFTMNKDLAKPILERNDASGSLDGNGARCVWLLPPERGTIHLDVCWREESLPSTRSIDIRWCGENEYDRRQWRFDSDDDHFTRQLVLAGGMLELCSQQPVDVRITWSSTEDPAREQRELISAESLVSCYAAEPYRYLHFPIRHVNDNSTPLRITVRRLSDTCGTPLQRQTDTRQAPYPPTNKETRPLKLLNGSRPSSDAGVSRPVTESNAEAMTSCWEFLDADERIVASGTLADQAPISTHDRVRDEPKAISEPCHYYFHVPPHVAMLRIATCRSQFGEETAASTLLVQCSTSLPDVPWTTSVPDRDPTQLGHETSHRRWFPLRPQEHREQFISRRMRVVTRQLRLPEEPTEDSSSLPLTSWERLLPARESLSRHLLIPQTDAPTSSGKRDADTFVELPLGVDVQLPATPTLDRQPRLIYVRDDDAPQQLQVFRDDSLVTQLPIHGYCGEVGADWPNDTANCRTRFELPSARLFVSGPPIADQGTHFYHRRTAIRWTETTIEYSYARSEPSEEAITIHYFRSPQVSTPTSLSVEFLPASETSELHIGPNVLPGPYRSLTSPQRKYVLQPLLPHETTAVGFVLGSRRETIDSGRCCHFLIGDDVPVGEYRLHIGRDTAEPAYVIVTRQIRSTQPDVRLRTVAVER